MRIRVLLELAAVAALWLSPMHAIGQDSPDTLPGAQRRITAIYRQDKYLSTALMAFLTVLQEG